MPICNFWELPEYSNAKGQLHNRYYAVPVCDSATINNSSKNNCSMFILFIRNMQIS